MKKTRYTEEQIIGVLKQMEAGRKVAELARELGVSEATLYTWKSKYGGKEVNEAWRLKELEEENRRLKQLVADLSLDREALKSVIRKNGWSLRVSGRMWHTSWRCILYGAQTVSSSRPVVGVDPPFLA
jgi:putative transposase